LVNVIFFNWKYLKFIPSSKGEQKQEQKQELELEQEQIKFKRI
jgi:hypothetical protein